MVLKKSLFIFILFQHYLDATSNSKMLSLVLKQKTLKSDVVINGLDAVNKCLSMGMDHYSLIFMDNMMPVMVIN